MILVLAAGEGGRFGSVWPKQVNMVGNETILGRIHRQLEKRGEIGTLVTHHPDIGRAWGDWPVFDPSPRRRWLVETMLATLSLWESRTIFLLADVVYSRAVMDRILTCQEPMMFFGHRTEIFALSFGGYWGLPRNTVIDSLKVEVRQAENGDIGKLRSLYWRCSGKPYGALASPGEPYLSWLDDYTHDCDTPGQWETFVAKVVAAGKLDDL